MPNGRARKLPGDRHRVQLLVALAADLGVRMSPPALPARFGIELTLVEVHDDLHVSTSLHVTAEQRPSSAVWRDATKAGKRRGPAAVASWGMPMPRRRHTVITLGPSEWSARETPPA